MAKHNAHKIFYGAPDVPDFATASKIDDDRIGKLRTTRDLARQAISDGFREWGAFVKGEVFLELSYVKRSPLPRLPSLKPKFRGQGSYRYRTMNDPAHQPPQQVDFDDGVFLPTSFVRLQGGLGPASPVVTSQGYFDLVERILAPVCEENGWGLDTSKPSCVRIVIDMAHHVDFALYAIPDEEFVALADSAALNAEMAKDAGDLLSINERVYRELDPNQIMLAHRTEGWKASDPRKLEDWFKDAIDTHGDQLRRICRYLKAWRDFNWVKGCNLSSITLMKCAVDAFDEVRGTISDKRDDAALLIVAKRLPEFFQNPEGIKNPVLPDQALNENWDSECREAYIAKANHLIERLTTAIEGSDNAKDTIKQLRDVFGTRIPNDESLVTPISAEAIVKQYPATKVPAPSVTRTTSG